MEENSNPNVVFRDGYYSVIDNAGNIIVPPGKYGYIDFYDTHGLTRVKINGEVNIDHPEIPKKDKWGIIDKWGREILPLEYDEIWKFCDKYRKTTKVVEVFEKIDGDGDPYTLKVIYDFNLFSKKLLEIAYYINDDYYEVPEEVDYSDIYTIWDALDGEESAAGNIDYEW